MRTVQKHVGVVIGVPTLGRPTCPEWGTRYAVLRPPINFNSRTCMLWGQEVADARNSIAQQAINDNARYVYFHGDDITAPGHTLQQLIYRAEHNPDLGVVGGIYCAKSEPTFPLVFRGNGKGPYWKWRVGEFFQITGIGMDCTLVRTDLFRQLEYPWFKTVRTDGYLDGEARVEAWTEDLWFCNRVIQETDYNIYADAVVMCEHWHNIGGDVWKTFTLRSDSYPMQPDPINSNTQILDLGCGPQHWNFGSEGQVTRVDLRDECEPDWRCDLRQLPFADQSYDIVFSSHTLEHFGRNEISEVLDEWLRVLKVNGELRLIIPNIAWAAAQISKGIVDANVLNVLYGSQEYPLNFHKVGFTHDSLASFVKEKGLEVRSVDTNGYNILLTAKKKC